MRNLIIWISLSDLWRLPITTTATRWTTQWRCLTLTPKAITLKPIRATMATLNQSSPERHNPRTAYLIHSQTTIMEVAICINQTQATWVTVMLTLVDTRLLAIWIQVCLISKNAQIVPVITKAQLQKNHLNITIKEARRSKVHRPHAKDMANNLTRMSHLHQVL